jgi:hypothetical protein
MKVPLKFGFVSSFFNLSLPFFYSFLSCISFLLYSFHIPLICPPFHHFSPHFFLSVIHFVLWFPFLQGRQQWRICRVIWTFFGKSASVWTERKQTWEYETLFCMNWVQIPLHVHVGHNRVSCLVRDNCSLYTRLIFCCLLTLIQLEKTLLRRGYQNLC